MMSTTDVDLEQWIGKQHSCTDVVSKNAITALAATLDHQPRQIDDGTALPELWHWLFFLNPAKQSELGADGHPLKGKFLPPIKLPRRMWAGSQLQFHHPIVVGDRIHRVSTIENIAKKSGRSGELIFVRVKHDISILDKELLAITEYHDIVYREAPSKAATPTNNAPENTRAPLDYDWKLEINADDTLLFRYSALTFNSHRIHYDRRYATQVEGYPGLVVHGPLISTLLLDGMNQQLGTQVIAEFEFKALKPLFDTHPFFVCGQLANDKRSVSLWATDHLNHLTMQATVTLT